MILARKDKETAESAKCIAKHLQHTSIDFSPYFSASKYILLLLSLQSPPPYLYLNSSMQHTPRSASTNAPASKVHSAPSFTAEQVKPAEVVPTPVVSTARGLRRAANRKNCDFPVPGSPTISKCDCARTCNIIF
jgi:hypothetical protein